jgi:hypothetical protein
MKKELQPLVRPIKPIEPKPNDSKYPKDRKSMRDMTLEEVENIPYIKDAKQYKKDLAKYEKDFELYEQTKFIRLIKNASEEYILKKYKIIKKD